MGDISDKREVAEMRPFWLTMSPLVNGLPLVT
nr:MAG TPA_asm: hypothetical protein [Caudoviricetes sp.]